jgi:hypothetical protein
MPMALDLVDVAGLIEGASKGAGLGNQFLSTIRECHVGRRCNLCCRSPQSHFWLVCCIGDGMELRAVARLGLGFG